MGVYTGRGKDTNTASTTLVGLSQPTVALKRLKLFYIEVLSSASADNASEEVIKRSTAAGTSTAFTPTLADPADGVASAVFGVNHSIEPTYTAASELLDVGGHQRSTFQWYAAPESELVIPVTNAAGLGLFVITAAVAYSQNIIMQWRE